MDINEMHVDDEVTLNATIIKISEAGNPIIQTPGGIRMLVKPSDIVTVRPPVKKVEEMNDSQYYVRGCTALLDAIGGAIHHISNVHKYAREEDVPEKTIFIITTDGMENSSRIYNYDRVKKMVKKAEKKYGWEFLFLGANIDAIDVAGRFGIRADRAINYECDSVGTRLNFEVMAKTVSAVRSSKCKADIDRAVNESCEKIREDYKKRHR